MKNIIIVVLISLIFSKNITAQNKWSVELRPGINFPTQEIDDIKLKTGFGIETAISYKIMKHVDAYIGWGWNKFDTDDSLYNDFEETGYTFGFQFIHPLGKIQKLSYLVRVGGIYNHVEVENDNGDIITDTGHGLGYEVGLGLNYEFSNCWYLRPQFGYRALPKDINIAGSTTQSNLNYVSFGLGILYSF